MQKIKVIPPSAAEREKMEKEFRAIKPSSYVISPRNHPHPFVICSPTESYLSTEGNLILSRQPTRRPGNKKKVAFFKFAETHEPTEKWPKNTSVGLVKLAREVRPVPEKKPISEHRSKTEVSGKAQPEASCKKTQDAQQMFVQMVRAHQSETTQRQTLFNYRMKPEDSFFYRKDSPMYYAPAMVANKPVEKMGFFERATYSRQHPDRPRVPSKLPGAFD